MLRARKPSAPRKAGLGLCLALSFSSAALADIRVVSHRWTHICRVVVVVDSAHGERVLFDGATGHGLIVTVKGGSGSTVCYSRAVNPNDCNQGMTRWRCKADDRSNRTETLSVQ